MAEIVVQADGGAGPVEARVGDVVVIELAENPTTGHSWQLASVPELCSLLGSEHEAATGPSRGAPGVRRVRLRVERPGSADVVLRLRRSWEPPDTEAGRVTVAIRAR